METWRSALRMIELTSEEMKGRFCSCPETNSSNEFGDGSSLPCMSWEPDNNLTCKQCIYCTKKENVDSYKT